MGVIAALQRFGSDPHDPVDASALVEQLSPWSRGAIGSLEDGACSVAGSTPSACLIRLSEGVLLALRGDRAAATEVARGWPAHGPQVFENARGEFASIVVEREGSLLLCRNLQSTHPLFFRAEPKLLAAASMPDALRGLGTTDGPALDQLALLAAQHPCSESHSMFRGIGQVPHGCTLRLHRDGCVEQLWRWRPPARQASIRCPEEAGEALRSALDKAVWHRVQRLDPHALVACELSGGRDSAAVTASLAIAGRRAGPTLAVTAAPAAGFNGPHRPGSTSDEAELAALVARLLPGVEHRIVRPELPACFERFASLSRLHHRPLVALSQFPWFDRLMSEARGADAAMVLSGGLGNFTVSLGGHFFLADVARTHGIAAAARHAWWMAGNNLRRWRSLLHAALGPTIPLPLYRLMLTATGGWSTSRVTAPLLREPYRAQAEAAIADTLADPRPTGNARAEANQLFMLNEPGELMHQAAYWMPVSDPTGDREVAEVVASIDPALLFPNRSTERPLYQAAFGERVPEAVINNRRRGMQVADWFLHFPPDLVRQRWQVLGRNAVVAELFDLAAIAKRIDRWPTSNSADVRIMDEYRGQMLTCLGVAEWIGVHFPD